jgi:hypothetical protein
MAVLLFSKISIQGGQLEMQENGMVFITWITKISPQIHSTTTLFFLESIKTNREKVFQYHCHLGHPSFRVMRVVVVRCVNMLKTSVPLFNQ